MHKKSSELIDISKIRIGMFVELGIGWMSHPFPTGSFKISSARQIETIRSLGLTQVRYFPEKSDLADAGEDAPHPSVKQTKVSGGVQPSLESAAPSMSGSQQRDALISAQRRSLADCESRFQNGLDLFKEASQQVQLNPKAAATQCTGLIDDFLNEVLVPEETSVRLLAQGAGDRAGIHAINVSVLAILLGNAMKLDRVQLQELGLAALLHDIGKTQLPEGVRWQNKHFSSAEHKLYQEHVVRGEALARKMGLSEVTVQAIGQHHEMLDGNGFPLRIKSEHLTLPARILAVVNRYENLCNPAQVTESVTPHEALSLLFAQMKTRFDGVVLGAFIRMMGVHPPGSLIQLMDDRYAMVVAANTSRPLKPKVIIHDPEIPIHEALVVDLEQTPDIGIRRSIKPANLPPASQDYLAPRRRVNYFFERIEPLAA